MGTLAFIHDNPQRLPNGEIDTVHPSWTICKCRFAQWTRDSAQRQSEPTVNDNTGDETMTDSIYLTGPDANVERETILAERGRVGKLDDSEIKRQLAETFCFAPNETLESLTLEQIVAFKYKLEAFVRTNRIWLMSFDQEINKKRAKVAKAVFDGLDNQYKPKPVPESKQANDSDYKLALKIVESKEERGIEISIEDALKLVREK